MNTQFMATIAGNDRPNLLKTLAEKTHNLGGKWLDSKISRLEGQLVGIIKIDMPEENMSALKADFNAIADFHVSTSAINLVTVTECEQVELRIEAKDKPGLISDITNLLDQKGVTIEHMENHRLSVAEVGAIVFYADLNLLVPVDLGTELLLDELKNINQDLRVEAVA